MLKTVTLPKNILPFQNLGDFEEFQATYIAAKKTNCLNSIGHLHKVLSNSFLHWAFLLETRQYYKNINIYTLLRLLQADDKTPGTLENKINLLEEFMEFFNVSYNDIILEAFLLHLQKPSYIPKYKYSKEKDLQYYIAKEVKMFIFSIFRKYINYQKKQNLISNSFKPVLDITYRDVYVDYAYINSLSSEHYKMYLDFILSGETIQKQINKEPFLCQLIKILLSNN